MGEAALGCRHRGLPRSQRRLLPRDAPARRRRRPCAAPAVEHSGYLRVALPCPRTRLPGGGGTFFYFPENIAVAHVVIYPWRTLAVAHDVNVRHG